MLYEHFAACILGCLAIRRVGYRLSGVAGAAIYCNDGEVLELVVPHLPRAPHDRLKTGQFEIILCCL